MWLSQQSDVMSFWGRLANLLSKGVARAVMCYHLHVCDRAIRRQTPREDAPGPPSAQELLGGLSGMLINTHSALDYPRLQPETFVNVGGLQIPREPGQLPDRLEEWVAGAPEPGGVVLMTLGSTLHLAEVPQGTVDSLMEAFSRIADSRFVVKYEAALDNVPENVLVLPFVPQRDVLAHPKTRYLYWSLHVVLNALFCFRVLDHKAFNNN